MCFDLNSVPPVFTEPKTSASGQKLILSSADSADFSAFLARPHAMSGVGILVVPDNRGLYKFYEDLAIRLAEQGHTALAIDYYGRTAGTADRQADFPFMQHIMRLTRVGLDHDIETGAACLRSRMGGACDYTFALGFCFGGRQAFLASAARFGFTGVIGFYGALSFYPNGAPGPLQRVNELRAPTLGIFGGADHGIPATDVSAFDDALTKAHVQHQFFTYPNAPHSFFDLRYAEFKDESADAWRRVLNFIEETVQKASGNR
jgi:carboxymethylenebutenolidase